MQQIVILLDVSLNSCIALTMKVILFLAYFSKMSTNIPSFNHLTVSVPKEFVYQVELNRSDKLNAINKAMFM